MPFVDISDDVHAKYSSLKRHFNDCFLGMQICLVFELLVVLCTMDEDFIARCHSKFKHGTKVDIPVSSFTGYLAIYNISPSGFKALLDFRNTYIHKGPDFSEELYNQLITTYLFDLLGICKLLQVQLDFTKPL